MRVVRLDANEVGIVDQMRPMPSTCTTSGFAAAD